MSPHLEHQNFVSGWVTFSVGLCSLCASLCILFLMYRFKRWNGYLMLISSLVTVQFLFDISHMLYISPTASNCRAIRFMAIISGLSVTVWTNIITFVAFYIVYFGRLVDIYGNYKYYLILALGIPAIFAICVLAENDFIETSDGGCFFAPNTVGQEFFDIYFYGRLLLIVSNSCVVLFITHLTKKIVQKDLATKVNDDTQLQQYSPSDNSASIEIPSRPAVADEAGQHDSADSSDSRGAANADALLPSEKTQAMIALIRRLKFYPLVQLICRSLSIWNEFDRGKFGGYPSELLSAIFSPAFGTGYFIVFLIVMPRAWETVRDYLCCRCSSEKRRPHDSAAINNMSENDLDMLIHEEDARAFNNSEHRIICCKSFDFSCWYHDQDENEESGIDTHAEAAPAAGGRAKTGRTAVPAKEEADDGTINPVFEKSKVQKMTIGGDAESGGSGGSAAATDSPKAPKGK